MKHISEVTDNLESGYFPFQPEVYPPIVPTRQFRATPLGDFRYDHLDERQEIILRQAVDGVKKWMQTYQSSLGQSLILSGPYGTGKTTMAENAMEQFRVKKCIVNDARTNSYLELIQAAAEKLPERDPRRVKLEEMLAEQAKADNYQTDLIEAHLFEASRLINLLGETDLNYRAEFGRYNCIVIDDAGTEEVAYANERTAVQKRQRRYGDFVEFCYRKGKHLIITTNYPLIVGDSISQEFIDIFGGKAFDRLYQMARGYLFDLHGLPTFRPYLVSK